MATEIWCELVCAGCARTSDGRYTNTGRVPRQALKRGAKRDGWTFGAEDEARCRKCSKQPTKGEGE